MKFSKAYEPDQYEPEIYALWEQSGAFKPTENKNAENYTIVMPPPNANGNLHIGHGLTIALEDILTRYHRLKGDNTWYIPGADHAGFETWVVYERKLESEGKTRFDYGRDELYDQVWNFVHEQRGNMELQLRALGASCDWDSLTFTLDQKVVDTVYNTFEKLWKQGLIYRGVKLVNFCTKHQTAFADIEVTHKDEKGKLWQIAYPLVKPKNGIEEIVVSTTRPETLLGDTAVAVNPEDNRYKNIIGQKVKLPLTDREIEIIADEHADPEYGTGVVKITPAHDPNDYEVGERHNLDMITVIGFDGKMTAEAGANYEGLTTADARQKVLSDLETQGLLRGEEPIVHSVGHCYKCDTVIEPLLKEQWFVNVEPLARAAIDALEANQIKFHPDNKKRVLINYLKNLKDWNISRLIQDMVDNAEQPNGEVETISNGEDWICREINKTNKEIQKLVAKYRFAEAGDAIYDLIWNKYADWFLEGEKLWKNVPLLKTTLEQILIMLHPFAPFVTETIWQALSWTDGMCITQNWPSELKFSATKAAKFEELMIIVTNIRSHFQSLPGAGSYPVAFYDDKLVYDNQLLIQHYTKAPGVPEIKPEDAKGLHLAIADHPNIYLEIPADIHAKYKANLEERILGLGKEIDVLETRLRNPNYVKKAPKELVDETKQQLETKQHLLDDMKAEFELV